jgi:hypothetical protein
LETTGRELNGIRGWLLLLCLNLAVLDPAAVLMNLFVVSDVAKPYFSRQPGFFHLILVNGIAGIALAVFSLYAGVSLFRRLPGAPETARKYFAAISAYALLAPFLPFLLRSEQLANRDTFYINCLNSVFTLAYAGIWRLYLKRSRRVRQTCGPSPASAGGGPSTRPL